MLTSCGNLYRLTADHGIANGTIDNRIIASCCAAGSRLFILMNCFCRGMAISIDKPLILGVLGSASIISEMTSTRGTSITFNMTIRHAANGFSRIKRQYMTQGANDPTVCGDLVRAFRIIEVLAAVGARPVGGVARISAGGGNGLVGG